MLVELGHDLDMGDIISYVVTKDNVKPVQMANQRDVDIGKYTEYLESMFKQLLDAQNKQASEHSSDKST